MATLGGSTTSEMGGPEPVRPWASVIVKGSDFGPGGVTGATTARYEKVRSFGVTSPFVPLSKKACVADPPIAVRLPLTARPVLGGLVPGVTATVRSVELPAGNEDGFAAPTPVGSFDCSGVSEKSSTAMPSSAWGMSKSTQRMKKVDPFAMFRPVIVKLMMVRLAARLPFKAPTAPLVIVLEKSRSLTSVYVPVDMLVAVVLYWKSRRSGAGLGLNPRRHCSPA